MSSKDFTVEEGTPPRRHHAINKTSRKYAANLIDETCHTRDIVGAMTCDMLCYILAGVSKRRQYALGASDDIAALGATCALNAAENQRL